MNRKYKMIGILAALLVALVVITACKGGPFDYSHTFPTDDFVVGTVANRTQEATLETETDTETPTAAEAEKEQETTLQFIFGTLPDTAKGLENGAETLNGEEEYASSVYIWHEFASKKLFDEHYEKHVIVQKEFGDITKEQYLQMVNDLLNSKGENILTKIEDDGDYLFYNVDTNEFAVMRPDGVIRSYFKPSAGIAYWNRQ